MALGRRTRPHDTTADCLHQVFEPTARAIEGLEKAFRSCREERVNSSIWLVLPTGWRGVWTHGNAGCQDRLSSQPFNAGWRCSAE
ncbi:MAG: hypothetical protein QOD88_4248, partial [Mycobacterium sp.]|nr:hypothetical protein [Mycobacterium sp.]